MHFNYLAYFWTHFFFFAQAYNTKTALYEDIKYQYTDIILTSSYLDLLEECLRPIFQHTYGKLNELKINKQNAFREKNTN